MIGFYISSQKAATSGPEKALGDSLRNNPDNLITNLGEVKAKLMTGRYAFSYVNSCTHIIMYKYLMIKKYIYSNTARFFNLHCGLSDVPRKF